MVLGVLYDGQGYSGASFSMTSTGNSGCFNGSSFFFPRLADYGWDNRGESILTYQGCFSQLYDLAFYSGTSATCVNCSSLGLINNKVSSIRFIPSGSL